MEAYTCGAVRDARRTVLAGRDAQSRALDTTRVSAAKLSVAPFSAPSQRPTAREAIFVQDAKGTSTRTRLDFLEFTVDACASIRNTLSFARRYM